MIIFNSCGLELGQALYQLQHTSNLNYFAEKGDFFVLLLYNSNYQEVIFVTFCFGTPMCIGDGREVELHVSVKECTTGS